MHSGEFEIDEKFTLIVAAAGLGKRMNLQMPKQYLELDSIPIYIYSVLVGEKSKLVGEIVIVAPEGDLKFIENQCKEYGISKKTKIVPGGKERQDSIKAGLQVGTYPLVAIQDGARPFMKESYLLESYRALQENSMEIDGTVIGVKAKDTVKIIDSQGIIISTPARENLVLAQTPQCFRREYILEIYKKAEKEYFLGTDDSSLAERYGGRIQIIPGDYENIKITTVEDIKIARSWKNENTTSSV